jgi:hypothetical protein
VADSKLRVQVGYGLKVPVNPSNTFAGSEDCHVSYSIEEDIDPRADKAQVAKRLSDMAQELDGGVKLAVAASLGVAFQTDTDGTIKLVPVVVPTVPVSAPRAQPTAAAPGPYQAAPAQAVGGGGGGGQYAPPKADLSKQPQVYLDYFNSGQPIAFYDQRSLKASGVYNPRAADYKSVAKFLVDGVENNISLWTHTKEGAVNKRTAQILAASAQWNTGAAAPNADEAVF